ncbi:MAG: hypothetical protein UY03_C0020G0003 [Parcubacteria group bacterium GW2011_GWA2_47_64]|nr:MAG: hypothetical protein UY03_C0020G0003 [Parcubacteria group bacterium GW2011_GWA2_47_64]KKU95795.1 MAG: hypothetical protein UY29_C0019G0015 [Parcubacteria group bacterium GW2011_GWC2_48_17]
MRLFLFNPDTPFTAEAVAERVRNGLFGVRQELSTLRQMRLIKNRAFTARVAKKKDRKHKLVRKKMPGFILNASFPYLQELRRLLLDTSLVKGDEIVRRLSSAGRLKLVIIAGLFIQDTESRLDILVVGDHLRRASIEQKIRTMESEIGKELQYASFETSEFNYRLGLYDKLIRDVLDYPHIIVLDKLGLPPLEIGRKPAL